MTSTQRADCYNGRTDPVISRGRFAPKDIKHKRLANGNKDMKKKTRAPRRYRRSASYTTILASGRGGKIINRWRFAPNKSKPSFNIQ